jgi:hypothetical protein
MRGQGKFLAFWAPKGVLSFFHHKFLGISTNITLSVIISTIAQKRGSSGTPQLFSGDTILKSKSAQSLQVQKGKTTIILSLNRDSAHLLGFMRSPLLLLDV